MSKDPGKQQSRTREQNPFGEPFEKTSVESLLIDLDVFPPARKKIAARVAEMPETMRRQYLRAMGGHTPRGAIKAFCRMCVGWKRGEVEECTDPACPLYPYRAGTQR